MKKLNLQRINISPSIKGLSDMPGFKKGGKSHRPFGHRSILDNGWQSTKQLKNTKNVYSKK